MSEPLKKYQSIASHIEDMEKQLHFVKDGYDMATWSGAGLLHIHPYTLSEADAVELAHWILEMTSEATYNNE